MSPLPYQEEQRESHGHVGPNVLISLYICRILLLRGSMKAFLEYLSSTKLQQKKERM